MRLFLTGGSGQVGLEIQRAFADWTIQAPGHSELDLEQPGSADQMIQDFRPNVVIHSAAATQVDKCEMDPAWADRLNYQATAVIALAAHRVGARLVYLSTDYVFNGDHYAPYSEDHPADPRSVYGRTKLRGELAVRGAADHLVVRTSWVYGEGKNFVRTMLRLAREGKSLRIVGDQIGRPTWARDLSQGIKALVEGSAPTGIYHFQNSGDKISWAGFARQILTEAGITHPVEEITTQEYLAENQGKTIAPRPLYSVLSLEKITPYIRPRDWKQALAEYTKEEKKSS